MPKTNTSPRLLEYFRRATDIRDDVVVDAPVIVDTDWSSGPPPRGGCAFTAGFGRGAIIVDGGGCSCCCGVGGEAVLLLLVDFGGED